MSESPPTGILRHVAAIEQVNRIFLMAARDAARDNVRYAMAAFGLPQGLAEWLASAGADQVLALARLPVCTFAVRVPQRALE
jgi:hypothetical protein